MKKISGEEVAQVIDYILQENDEGFEEILEMGFDSLAAFSETLKESGSMFTVTSNPED